MGSEAGNLESKWEISLLPFVLCFLMISINFFNSTYADALFLSTYPRDWLTYYFFAVPALTVFLYFFISPFIAKASNRHSFLFILSMEVILLISYKLIDTNIYVMPFILTLLLAIFAQLVGIIGWNIIAAAFDIRVFKNHVFQFNMLGTIGAISTSFCIPVIIYFFQSAGVFYHGCPILICIEVNQLARSAPFSLEGEGLGMRVAGVARYRVN